MSTFNTSLKKNDIQEDKLTRVDPPLVLTKYNLSIMLWIQSILTKEVP
ncbi:MAG: hypothetical protein WA364_21565 [Candidatus Nitrosopolaris sp.]